jgi:hypothetical protein
VLNGRTRRATVDGVIRLCGKMRQKQRDSTRAGVQIRTEGTLDDNPRAISRLHRRTDPVASIAGEDRVAAKSRSDAVRCFEERDVRFLHN